MNLHKSSRHTTALVLIMGAALLLEGGCGSARRGTPVIKPIETADARVKRGEIAFYRACNSCHIGGATGLGPALNDKPLPGFLIRFQVRNGLGAMPAFSKAQLSDAELDAIVAYLQVLREKEWPEEYLSVQTD